jgi:drug/metabolite transporter (DMT)-like permease
MAFRIEGVGTVWVVLAALSYGVMQIFVKLSVPYLTVWQTAIGRFALGAIVIPILAWPLRQDLLGKGRWLLIGRGLASTAVFLLLIQAYKSIPLSTGMVLFYLWPVFASLLSAWIAGEPTTKREWPFVFGALAGTMLILWPDRAGPALSVGHFLALGASFLGGLAVVLIRPLGRTNNPFTIYFYQCLAGGLFCLGPLLSQAHPIIPVSRAGWLGLIAVAAFAMAGQVFMNQGMKYLSTSKTGVLMMLEVVVSATFGIVFLDETFSVRLLLGAALILGCGVALINLPMHRATYIKTSTPAKGE